MLLRDLLPELSTDRPVHRGPLTMVPLMAARLPHLEPLCLDQALERRALEIRERRGGAQVNEVEAVHRGRRPVLLLAGEELVGALQNRILDTSAWLAGGQSTFLPVSCVEQGRWSRSGDAGFSSGRSMYLPTSRATHVREVTESYQTRGQARADQTRVWADVGERLRRGGVRSQTQRMHDLYEQAARDLRPYEETLRPTREQCGFAFLAGRSFLGLEVFPTPGFCRVVFPKYLRSYAMETASLRRGLAPEESRARRAVDRMLAELRRTDGADYPAPGGTARDVRFRAARFHGSALAVDGLGVVHLGAFAA